MIERPASSGAAARWAYLAVVAAGFVLMVALNWPGHLSVDSVQALHEGRFGVRISWNPAIYSWLLGVADRITPGAALVVPLTGLLVFGGWAAMAALRPRTSWLAPVLALGAIALPQALIYPAIIWKDVLFAAAAVAAFVSLALALRSGRPGLGWLALAALLFAAAGLFRQNGLIVTPFAAAAIVWGGWRGGGPRALALGAGWLAAVAVLTLLLSAVAKPQGPGAPDNAGGRGLRMLQSYDLAAASALRPGRPLPRIDRAAPDVDDYIVANAGRLYSPERVDVLTADPWLGKNLRRVPREVIRAEWLDLITGDPTLYLKGRLLHFRQVAATPDIDRCLPVHLGVEGLAPTLRSLDLAPRRSLQDMRLYNYATWFLDTPAMSHLPYAALALLVGVCLLVRRDPADLAMAAMMAGALAFAASFLAISIACDYRYLYFLDLAAITGVLYLALDPRLRRRA